MLEGLHAVKHALRFGAEILEIAIASEEAVAGLAGAVAPDVADELLARADEVGAAGLEGLAPRSPETGVIAIARRTGTSGAEILADTHAPVVLLENPRNLGNLGACIRVAAAAGVAGVLSTGDADPWHPEAIRGAAALHYAVPVARLDALGPVGRPLLAIDPGGADLEPDRLPHAALLAFGTERHGLSDEVLARAEAVVRVPMEPGVSSLNLATTVAAVLFAWRLAVPAVRPAP